MSAFLTFIKKHFKKQVKRAFIGIIPFSAVRAIRAPAVPCCDDDCFYLADRPRKWAFQRNRIQKRCQNAAVSIC